MIKKVLLVTLILMLVLSSFTFAFADGKERGEEKRNKIEVSTKNEEKIENEENGVEIEEELEIEVEQELEDEDIEDQEELEKEETLEDEVQNEDENDENNDNDVNNENNVDSISGATKKGKGKGLNKEWEKIKEELEIKKDEVEAQKDEIEDQKDELEKQYEEAVENGDAELANTLKVQIEELKGQMDTLKQEMKRIKLQRKEVVRNKYTEEELERLQEAEKEILAKNKNVKVLEVDSILSNKAEMKFDTPPVIKGGRTLVPVRAIVEGFGAQVDWNGETREVTIIKGDIEILLPIDNSEVYVNGEKVVLDTKSEIMSSRTYVPLRFIAETLGLAVNWDGETETIELEEEITDGENTSENLTTE